MDVNTAVIAADRLQTLIDTRAGQPDVDMRVKVNRIIDAVRSMLPESSWPELLRRIDGVHKPTRRITRLGPWTPPMRSSTRGDSPTTMTTMTTCNQSRVRQRATPVHCDLGAEDEQVC